MRTNTKEVVKKYDNDEFNGWTLAYEYESQDGAKPAEIRVTGTKGTGSLFLSKSGTNTSVNFNGGADLDPALIENIKTEFAAIEASFEATEEEA